MTEPAEETVLVSWPSAEIGVITVNRPERLNALTHDVVDALVERLTAAGAQPECRVLVLTGAGRGFCAGLDIAANVDADSEAMRSLPQRMGGQEKFASMVRTIRSLRQPVVAAVNGAAAGAGMARDIARNSPFAVWQTKQVMWANLDASFEGALAVENRAQILAVHTDDAREAMRAFVEKRPPTFTGT